MLFLTSNKFKTFSLIPFLCLFPIIILAQTNRQFKKLFIKAEGYFLFEEDHHLAVPIYLKLLEQDPGNANLNYKIGVCYLSIPGKKREAVSYLEEAVKRRFWT